MINESQKSNENTENIYNSNARRNSRDFRLRTVKFINFNNIYKKVNNQPISAVTKLINLSPRKIFYNANNNLIKSNNLMLKLQREGSISSDKHNSFLSASPDNQRINIKEKETPVIIKTNQNENEKNCDFNSLMKPMIRLKSSSNLFNLTNKKYRYSRSNIPINTECNFKGRVSRRKLATMRPVFSYQLTEQKNLDTKSPMKSNNFINFSQKLKLSNSKINQNKNKRNSINVSEENFNNRNASKKSLSLFSNNVEKNLRKSPVSRKNQIQSPKKIHNINPFVVPEEDKIFDEMKSYLCFKLYSEENNKSKKSNLIIKKNESKNIVNTNPNKNVKVKPKNKKRKKILSADDKKLESLYSFSYSVNNKLKIARRTKNVKELEEYQECLLENIKPILNFYSYMDLKRKFEQICEKVQKKYKNNLENIKEIENDEEYIINCINSTCKQCLKTFSEIRTNKTLLHATNLKVKLPMIKFVTCIKSHKKLKNKNKNDKNKQKLGGSKNKKSRNYNVFNKSIKSGNTEKEVCDTDIYSLTNYNKKKSIDSIKFPINKSIGNDNKRYSIKSIKSIKV